MPDALRTGEPAGEPAYDRSSGEEGGSDGRRGLLPAWAGAVVVTGKAERLLFLVGREKEKDERGWSWGCWLGGDQSGWLREGGGSRLRASKSESGMAGSTV